MRRPGDVRSEPFLPPRAFRPTGRDLDLTAGEDAAKLKRLFAAEPLPVRVTFASGDALTAVASRAGRPPFGTAVRRLAAWSAERLKQARRARPRTLELALDASMSRLYARSGRM
jgi:hypothetical protein